MQRGDRLYTLDGLRGVAAILVLLSHIELKVQLAPGGHLAVDFFFALSGVVIAENYGRRLRAGLAWRRFMRTRLIRLYPMFLAGLLLGLARALAQIAVHQPSAMPPPEVALAFGLGLVMLPSPLAVFSLYPLLAPGWSLLFELIANAIYALRRARWGVPLLCGVCIAAAIGLWPVKHPEYGLNLGYTWDKIYVGLLRVAYSFTIGVILYEALLSKGRSRATPLALLPMAAVAALMLAPVGIPARGVFDWVCVTVVLPLLVLLGARWNPPAALRAPFTWLGELSYPLYTTHYPLLFVASYAAPRLGIPPALWVPVLVCGLILFAFLLARFVDEPIRARINRRVGSSSAAAPQL